MAQSARKRSRAKPHTARSAASPAPESASMAKKRCLQRQTKPAPQPSNRLPARTSLLGLPVEIRLIIYDHLFEDCPMCWGSSIVLLRDRDASCNPPLARIPQLREEVLRAYYKRLTLFIQKCGGWRSIALEGTLDRMGEANLRHLRHILVEYSRKWYISICPPNRDHRLLADKPLPCIVVGSRTVETQHGVNLKLSVDRIRTVRGEEWETQTQNAVNCTEKMSNWLSSVLNARQEMYFTADDILMLVDRLDEWLNYMD